MRRAIVPRKPDKVIVSLTGTTDSTKVVLASPPELMPSAADLTSSSVTRPLGPVPVTFDKSTPISLASRRARGVTICLPPFGAADGTDAGLATTTGAGVDAEPTTGATSGRSDSESPDSKTYPSTVPTSTIRPASTSILPSVPSAVASTSALTLADSISTS